MMLSIFILPETISNMQKAMLPLVLAVLLACGCIENPDEYACPDGSMAPSLDACPIVSSPPPTVDVVKKLSDCDAETVIDERYACYTNTAIASKDLSVCDKITSDVWHRFCYRKLNMSMLLPPEETTTITIRTLPTLTITSTTTTTLQCGNGVVDGEEKCDVGGLCQEADGVCGILDKAPHLVTCLVNGTCDWNSQISPTTPYAMGACMGCYGPSHPNHCSCIGPNIVNTTSATIPGAQVTNTSTWVGVEETKTTVKQTHSECDGGLCRQIAGPGTDTCTSTDQCRYYACDANKKCVLYRTPGTSTCKDDTTCAV
jgi:hypothetical protein